MPTAREDHSCGLITDPEHGPQIVVAGGSYSPDYFDTVDIYTVNTDSWTEGNVNQNQKLGNQGIHVSVCITANPLPKPIARAAIVPFDNSFLLTGGESDGGYTYLKDIYQYNPTNDEWIKLESELQTERSFHVALLVPQSLFPECT